MVVVAGENALGGGHLRASDPREEGRDIRRLSWGLERRVARRVLKRQDPQGPAVDRPVARCRERVEARAARVGTNKMCWGRPLMF